MFLFHLSNEAQDWLLVTKDTLWLEKNSIKFLVSVIKIFPLWSHFNQIFTQFHISHYFLKILQIEVMARLNQIFTHCDILVEMLPSCKMQDVAIM